MKKLSQMFVFLLLADAFIVFMVLLNRGNAWILIVLYWFLLTCKNFVDYIAVKLR